MNKIQIFRVAIVMIMALSLVGHVVAQKNDDLDKSQLQKQISETETAIEVARDRIKTYQQQLQARVEAGKQNEDEDVRLDLKSESESAKIAVATFNEIVQSLQMQRVETLVEQAGIQARLSAFEEQMQSPNPARQQLDSESIEKLEQILALQRKQLERLELLCAEGDVNELEVQAKQIEIHETELRIERSKGAKTGVIAQLKKLLTLHEEDLKSVQLLAEKGMRSHKEVRAKQKEVVEIQLQIEQARLLPQSDTVTQLEEIHAIQVQEMENIERLVKQGTVSARDLGGKRKELLETKIRIEQARQPEFDPRMNAVRFELSMSSAELAAKLEMIAKLLAETQNKREAALDVIARQKASQQRDSDATYEINQLAAAIRIENQTRVHLTNQLEDLKRLQGKKEER